MGSFYDFEVRHFRVERFEKKNGFALIILLVLILLV